MAIEVVSYNENWPSLYEAERRLLASYADFLAFEHIGSTSIPGLEAKPIIDMMAAVRDIDRCEDQLAHVRSFGYEPVETGMVGRLFFRRSDTTIPLTYHLHIVAIDTWATRNERLFRDYLLRHQEATSEYGELKKQLARGTADDPLAYTRAKTAFVQKVVDTERTSRGLPLVNVWE